MTDPTDLRDLVEARLAEFDLAACDEDPLPQLIEEAVSRKRRLGLGQFFSPTPLIDLIEAFCIRRSGATVLDPACGTGSFLVRALARKRFLDATRPARVLVGELFGVDAAPLAADLTRRNLAARGGSEALARSHVISGSFFDVAPPNGGDAAPIPRVDAVVGNPPWVQQESLASTGTDDDGHGGGVPGKDELRRLARDGAGAELSGRSDLHAYFWPQASRFLRPGGRLGFVTSSQWLDAGYGQGLRRWIATRFSVEVIIESGVEPWFPGARVDSAIAILRLEPDPGRREANPVRYFRLRQPLDHLLGRPCSTVDALRAADRLRDDLLSRSADGRDETADARILAQRELGARVKASPGPATVRPEGPWGATLRSPAVWRELTDATGTRWTPLGRLARVRRGLTTGCDRFFYIRPGATGAAAAVDEGHLVAAVHGPLGLDRARIRGKDCGLRVLWLGGEEVPPPGSGTARYLRSGEARGVHRRPTCAGRARGTRRWYDLTRERLAGLLWPKERQYRHVVAVNPDRVVANCRLYEVVPGERAADLELWGGVLNSSWVLLSALQHGRPVGSEAVWSTMVGEVRRMTVPDPTRAAPADRRRVARAFGVIAGRPIGPLTDEIQRDDRRRLDDAVLRLLGVREATGRDAWLDRLYAFLAEHVADLRAKERRAVENKRRRGQSG